MSEVEMEAKHFAQWQKIAYKQGQDAERLRTKETIEGIILAEEKEGDRWTDLENPSMAGLHYAIKNAFKQLIIILEKEPEKEAVK
jgi:hypothetical protein